MRFRPKVDIEIETITKDSERKMHPIQMQAGNRGIGMGYAQFVDTFESVCGKHLREGRARAFAFISYDMTHGVVREALMQSHGFKQLHEKTGSHVTLFYLHENAVDAHWQDFDLKFIAALEVENQVSAPYIVFFRVQGDDIEDVSICAIDEKSTDPVLLVAELEQYVDHAVKIFNAEGNFSALTALGRAVF